jgi:4-hydroxybutyrate dehydrogenase / sulfolactaldehyde 3-reductase
MPAGADRQVGSYRGVIMSPPRTGFIGLGRMGRPMASNLQRKGFATLSFDINPEPVAALIKLGGEGARSAEEVARRSDVIFTMLPASPEVRSVVLGSVLPNSKPGTLIVDMSTIDPLPAAATSSLLPDNSCETP